MSNQITLLHSQKTSASRTASNIISSAGMHDETHNDFLLVGRALWTQQCNKWRNTLEKRNTVTSLELQPTNRTNHTEHSHIRKHMCNKQDEQCNGFSSHRPALISVSLALNQTPVYTASARPWMRTGLVDRSHGVPVYIPAFTGRPTHYAYPQRDGQAELTSLVAGYISRWFARLPTVTLSNYTASQCTHHHNVVCTKDSH